jgi:hypothetical protein
MNPWISIWTKTTETIDKLKDSNWVNKQGLIPYFIFGVNVASKNNIIPKLLGYESKAEGLVIVLTATILLGLIAGIILRVVWVNLIFYFGKIWKGQASHKNINTVISLCLIPEIFKLANLIFSYITQNNIAEAKISFALTIICLLISLRILLIGLSRVQKFSYGISVLNIFVPQLIIGIMFYSIRELYI